MDSHGPDELAAQLVKVQEAITINPDNKELISLKKDLKALIDVVAQQQAAVAKPDQSSSSSRKAATAGSTGGARTWIAGDECLAKYSDGNWYPARILSVGGAADNCVYSIIFVKYNTSGMVNPSEIKPRPSSYQASGANPRGERKRPKEEEEDAERKRKKKKIETKIERKAEKAKEQNAKQASWQKFAKKAEKKGVHIAGMSGTSIFKTPDNPLGKVGVTGSGKGMTSNAERPNHRFTHEGIQS